jgi:hypothetical protein
MPLDQSDRIRTINQTKIFQGWAIQQQSLQPGVNVSTCGTFYTSTIHKFGTYNYGNEIYAGQKTFRDCQVASSSNT